MALIKTNALILKYVNLNDNDRLFTAFSPEIGKFTAMSKGVRSHKHKDFAALQIFCYSELVIDNSKGIYYINSASVKENFFDLRTSVEKTSLATYFTDLVSFLADEIVFDDDFFSFVLNTLYLTANAEKRAGDDISAELLRLKTIFEVKCACVSGYMPAVSECASCRSKTSLDHFDSVSGCAVCDKCYETYSSPGVMETSESALKIIEYISLCNNKQVFSFRASPEVIEDANSLSENYLINKLEYASSMLDYLKSL